MSFSHYLLLPWVGITRKLGAWGLEQPGLKVDTLRWDAGIQSRGPQCYAKDLVSSMNVHFPKAQTIVAPSLLSFLL